ncbi:H-NS family histone-like protein [Vibrio owensii]|uniref:H-NS family histone-like protein n=1 Tax=Vibrio owensii TaxID=696485 RepID=UPI0003643148|nr:hypothetical protein [Vibrio owensii]
MQDIIKKLSNPRQAKTVLKHASVEQLERVLNVIAEFKEEKELEAKMQAEREQQERQSSKRCASKSSIRDSTLTSCVT